MIVRLRRFLSHERISCTKVMSLTKTLSKKTKISKKFHFKVLLILLEMIYLFFGKFWRYPMLSAGNSKTYGNGNKILGHAKSSYWFSAWTILKCFDYKGSSSEQSDGRRLSFKLERFKVRFHLNIYKNLQK